MFKSTKQQAHRVDTTDDNLGDEGFVAFIQNDTVVSRSKVADLKSKPLKINPALMPCDVLNGEVDESKSIEIKDPFITHCELMSERLARPIPKITSTRTHLSPTAPWPDFSDTVPSVPGELHIPRHRRNQRTSPWAYFAPALFGALVGAAITLTGLIFAIA